MSLLNFGESDRGPAAPRSKKPLKLILGIGALAGVIAIGSTLAANINLNTGVPTEFGQGVASATACDGEILVTPFSTFTNANGAGGYSFSSLKLSNINSDSNHCEGKQFVIQAFGTGASPLTLYGNSTSIIVCDRGSNFLSFSSHDYRVTSADGNSFIASIKVPLASSMDVKRLTIESTNQSCSLFGKTYKQNVSVPAGNGSPAVVNDLLPSDKLSADGFTGRVRATISVDCGSVGITSTTGLTLVYGYQSPLNGSASAIAFEGTVADVNAALNTLSYDRSTCTGKQHLTSSISQASNDPNSPISYNPDNGHYYQYISAGGTWDQAFNTITGGALDGTDGYANGIVGTYNLNRKFSDCHYKFNGMCGYMATVTSEAEDIFIGNKVGSFDVWLGGSDRRNPGTWVWEDDRSPEYGTVISTYGIRGDDPTKIRGSYSHWCCEEPNNYSPDEGSGIKSGETAIQTYASAPGVPPTWNNMRENAPENHWQLGYLIEFGGSPVDTGDGDKPETHLITLTLQ